MASKTIILKEVILSFPENLWTPGTPKNAQSTSKPKYSCQFLVELDSDNKKLIDATIKEVAQQEWKAKAGQILASIEGNTNRMCFIDGNRRVGWAGYENRWGISAGRYPNNGQPLLIKRDKSPVKEADGLLYGGAIVNAKIDIFTYDTPSPGVSAGLQVVQFVRHGQSFGGAPAATADDMEDLPFEDEMDGEEYDLL